MLDECKGERLEEVLTVFSSAVLKRAAEEQQIYRKQHPTAAQTLALENRGYAGERTELSPLLLAHKVSLKVKLNQKKASRAQYKSFAELLDSKEQSLARRREQAAARGRGPKIAKDEKSNVRRAVRNNWAGNEQWLEALVHGDARATQDGVLTTHFDRVWRRVRTNRLGELENKSGGLLQQLDSRVRAQQVRLGKWQNFQKEMFGDVSDPPVKRSGRVSGQKGIDLGLGAHESLQLGRLSPRRLTRRTNASQVDGEYDDLLATLEAELREVNKVSAPPSLGRLRGRTQRSRFPEQSTSHAVADEPVSELSELEEEDARAPAPLKAVSKGHSDGPEDANAISQQQQKSPRPTLPQPLSSMPAFRPKSQTSEISPIEPARPQLPTRSKMPSPRRSPTRSIPPSPSLSPSGTSPPQRTESPEQLPPSPTQQQADQILASMSAASPSPIKQLRPRHTLSLAERTRLSLARGSSGDLDDDELGIVSPVRPSRRNTSSRSPKKHKPTTPTTISEDTATANFADPEADRTAEEDDLVARTRKSMANFEAAQQKARLERQRSQKRAARQRSGPISRQAYFPSLDEEGGATGEDSSTVVLEELMAKEQAVDYDSVFKSRPKIKTSPPATPVCGNRDEEYR